MKRRTFRQPRAKAAPGQHHNVYVVRLKRAVGKLKKVRAGNPDRDPKKPCVYVGLTGLRPVERFANHKAGIKAAAVVKRYGLRLLPELFPHLTPCLLKRRWSWKRIWLRICAKLDTRSQVDIESAELAGKGRGIGQMGKG